MLKILVLVILIDHKRHVYIFKLKINENMHKNVAKKLKKIELLVLNGYTKREERREIEENNKSLRMKGNEVDLNLLL